MQDDGGYRLTAQQLAERVEAGERRFADAVRSKLGLLHTEAGAAMCGSLDACADIMGRVLPDWARDVDATLPSMGIEVQLHGPEGEQVTGSAPVEAHAWLAAILRAFVSRREAGDDH